MYEPPLPTRRDHTQLVLDHPSRRRSDVGGGRTRCTSREILMPPATEFVRRSCSHTEKYASANEMHHIACLASELWPFASRMHITQQNTNFISISSGGSKNLKKGGGRQRISASSSFNANVKNNELLLQCLLCGKM